MCLRSKKSDSLKKITASEDFVCYKCVHEDLLSQYHYFPYEVGKEYSLGEEITIDKNSDPLYNQIDKGFHSYVNLRDAKWQKDTDNYYGGTYIIIKCVIPKGSTMYVGHNMMSNLKYCVNYVSDRIKVVEIVKE